MKRILGILIIAVMLSSLCSCFLMKDDEGGDHTHTPEKIEAIAATCTKGGNGEYYRCTGCGQLFSDSACLSSTTAEENATAPLGHAWVDATCTAPKTCELCGDTEGEALGHDWSGSCDTECNRDACTEERSAESHLDSNEDDICDNCGEDASFDIPVGDGGAEFLPPDEF